MHTTVANAIRYYLASQVQIRRFTRRFFRLDGFDEQTYSEFLSLFNKSGNIIEGQSVWIRTAAPIGGYEEYALEAEKSSTWYRNNVPSGFALILIFNSYTTDAQSLKDIFPITENTLATKGLSSLITAAGYEADYQLNSIQLQEIVNFIQRLRKNLFSPQLRDLVEFLVMVTNTLKQDAGASVEYALSIALPCLGLFAANELTKVFDTPRGDRLLKDNYRAALLGSQLLDDKELKQYEMPLAESDFDDDSAHGGLTSEQKRKHIEHFLREVITSRSELLQILQIDWREVSPILHKRTRKTKEEKRQELADSLADAVEEQQIQIDELSENTQEAIQDIRDGREPRDIDLESLIDELGDNLPASLKKDLKRLRGTIRHQTQDFLAGIVHVAVDLSRSAEATVSDTDCILVVEYSGDMETKVSAKLSEALFVFNKMYGGIETWMPAVSWNLESFWEFLAGNAHLIGDDNEEDGQREKVIKETLEFRVILRGNERQVLASADLIWLYRSDGPDALTALHLWTAAQSQNINPLPIPIYNTCSDSNEIGDLDLSRPIASFGTWYRECTDLYKTMSNTLKPRISNEEWQNITNATQTLEKIWNDFVSKAASTGLYSANIPQLLNIYQHWLAQLRDNLQHGQSATYGYRELTKAWIVGRKSFDDWAIVPMLHPMKLQWWHSRAIHFDRLIHRIVTSLSDREIIDEKRFQRELNISFSSGHSPSVLALPDHDQRVNYFLPVSEMQGYELYRHENSASVAYGLDPELVTEAEGEEAEGRSSGT